jgi:hypothetical protein
MLLRSSGNPLQETLGIFDVGSIRDCVHIPANLAYLVHEFLVGQYVVAAFVVVAEVAKTEQSHSL